MGDDSICSTAEEFVRLFYDKMDTKRHQVAKHYLDSATIAFNGNAIQGIIVVKIFGIKSRLHYRNLRQWSPNERPCKI